jgi:outer membrane protein
MLYVMKKSLLCVVLIAAFLGGTVQAQTTPPASPPLPAPGIPIAQPAASSNICFVDAQRVLAGHPQGAKVLEAQKKAQEELKTISDKILPLQAKIANNTASPAERQQYDTLVKTYQASQSRLKAQIDRMLVPITKDVDVAVTKVALAKGCSVVFDRAIAAQSGLVVYVNPAFSVDISDDVILEISKPK